MGITSSGGCREGAASFRRMGRVLLAAALMSGLLLPSAGVAVTTATPDRAGQAVNPALKAPTRVPFHFEENRGQADPAAAFLSRGPGYSLMLTPAEAVLALRPVRTAAEVPAATTVRMRLTGANPDARAEGLAPLPGVSNYLIGNDPGRWVTGARHFARVRFASVYPGVDLVYYGNGRQLEYDFVVAPGSDPGAIGLAFSGARDLRIDADGNLVLRTPGGDLAVKAPDAYQEIDGRRVPVAVGYTRGEGNRIGFAVGPYDPGAALVIDPVFLFSTYFGGSDAESVPVIATDAGGATFVAGRTNSLDLLLASAAQSTSGGVSDLFLVKLDPSGGLVFSTYFGGNLNDTQPTMVADGTGGAYLVGSTGSTDIPTFNAAQPGYGGGGSDLFVAHFDGTGALLFSTYLGGSGGESVGAAVADATGTLHLTGTTTSLDFPVVNAFQETHAADAGNVDGFVAALTPGGAFDHATYLGGGGHEFPVAIGADASGGVVVTGYTGSSDFPTLNAAQPLSAGGNDVFVTRLDPAGQAVYSTYLGGGGSNLNFGDHPSALAVDSAGNAVVAGETSNTNFPTVNAWQSVLLGQQDAFVARFNAGGALVFSTYFGDGFDDVGGVGLDASGNAYVAGGTTSATFPTLNAADATYGGSHDGFVAKFSPAGLPLFSTFVGGSAADTDLRIDVGPTGGFAVAGKTGSTDFPVFNAAQPVFGGLTDVFVALYDASGAPIMSTYLGGTGSERDAVVAFQGAEVHVAGLTRSTDFPTFFPLQPNIANASADDFFIAKISLADIGVGGELCDGIDNNGNGLIDEGFSDTDGDGTPDCLDDDDDNDGYLDVDEVSAGSNPFDANSTPEVCDGVDNDQDGQVDEGFPNTDGDTQADCVDFDDDNDGLTDVDEAALGTDPLNADTDGDGMPDGWEVDNGLDPLTHDAALDPDEDGRANVDEYLNGSPPLRGSIATVSEPAPPGLDRRHPSIDASGNRIAYATPDGRVFVLDRQAETVSRVDLDSSGDTATGGNPTFPSGLPVISANGRYVAFVSAASDLVAGDTNGAADVFVHDLQTGATERVSVATGGAQGDGESGALSGIPGIGYVYGNTGNRTVSISADGNLVVFSSRATTLVGGDTNGVEDVFLRDRAAGITIRVSETPGGTQADGESWAPFISADGSAVSYISLATNLVTGDTNGISDVFVYTVSTSVQERANVASDGSQAADLAVVYYPDFTFKGQAPMSADGRYVVFTSHSGNLVPDDVNARDDIFVHDRQTGATERITPYPELSGSGGDSHYPSISADGRYVAFTSYHLEPTTSFTTDQIYLQDRQTGTLAMLSTGPYGTAWPDGGMAASINADGNYIAFDTPAYSVPRIYLAVRGAAATPTGDAIIWTDLVNVAASGPDQNTLTKITSGGAWGAGAASAQVIPGDGAVEFTAQETTLARMVGLSNVNADAEWQSIAYAIHLTGGGTVNIAESGAIVAINVAINVASGGYLTGDVFRIERTGSTIRYYQNGGLLHTSSVPSSGALLADASLNQVTASVANGVMFGAAPVVPDTTPPVIGNVAVSGITANQATVTWDTDEPATSRVHYGFFDPNESSSPPDTNLVTSHSVTLTALAADTLYLFQVESTDGSGNSALSPQDTFTTPPVTTLGDPVVWTDFVGTAASPTPNSLTKITSAGAWGAGAASVQVIPGDGALEFTTQETNDARMVGLSNVNADAEWQSIAYAIHLTGGGTVNIAEGGAIVAINVASGGYLTGDVFRIERTGSTIRYYRNGGLLHTSSVPSSGALLADASLNQVTASVANAVMFGTVPVVPDTTPPVIGNVAVSGITDTQATVTWDTDEQTTEKVWFGISNPFDMAIGGGGPLSASHSITLPGPLPDLMPDTTYQYVVESTDASGNVAQTSPDTFTTAAGPPPPDPVVWTDLVNAATSGVDPNTITKTGGGPWGAGAASVQTIPGDGAVEFTAQETNTARMAGLSSFNADAHFSTIGYAIHLTGGGTVNVWEGGVKVYSGGTYTSGDVLRVERTGTTVRYLKNNVPFYTSGTLSTGSLVVDVSLNQTGATVADALLVFGTP